MSKYRFQPSSLSNPSLGVASMSEGASDKDLTSYIQISEKLFEVRDTAHKYHLLQRDRSIATHKALETLYDEVLDLADDFTECWFGLYGPHDIDWNTQKIESPVTYVQSCYTYIDQVRKGISESFLQNLIDELQAELSHCLYRLKYVTALGSH